MRQVVPIVHPASRGRRPRRLVLYLLGLGTVTMWGASFPITKAALQYTGPTAVAFLRWTVSALFLVTWLALAGRRDLAGTGPARSGSADSRPPQSLQSLSAATSMLRARWRTVSWVALTGVTFFYFLENLALRYTTAINASVLANFTSVFIVLIGALVLHERLGALEWAALAAAMVGSALVSQGASHITLGGTGLIGDAMMIVACLFSAIYSIGGKALSERYGAMVVTTVVAAVGALFLLPLALIEGLTLKLAAEAWAMILILGIGSGALANLFWMSLLRHTAASRAALILFLIPLVSGLLAVILLDEPITPLLVIGSALVLAGVLVVQTKNS